MDQYHIKEELKCGLLGTIIVLGVMVVFVPVAILGTTVHSTYTMIKEVIKNE